MSVREQATRRTSFRRSLAEAALPEEFLGQLEDKRRQLDESIHKYIAAKERDYKGYEKELRQQHRIAQGQQAARVVSRSSQDGAQVAADQTGDMSTIRADRNPADGSDETDSQLDRQTIAGLRDRRASIERDKDFVGLFTPAYLPAIDDRDGRGLERTSSAPPHGLVVASAESATGKQLFERSNSDSLVQAKPKRPSQLALAHRTSSSGSSADGKLMSAMKSPSQRTKRKRVSLAVGDEIVAPSDNVPTVPVSNTPSHSRRRAVGPDLESTEARKGSTLTQSTPAQEPTLELSLHAAEQAALARATAMQMESLPDTAAIPLQQDGVEAAHSASVKSAQDKIDPDGDLFDLEAEDDVAVDHDDQDFENALESEDELEVAHRDGHPISPDQDDLRYDPESGLIPESKHGTDSAVPYFGTSASAVASQQPLQPGFRRPSVVDDPVYRGRDYRDAERDAVEHDVYGSSFSRPNKGSFTAGSVGESYMAAHSEEMMKLRNGRRQAEVES